MGLFGTGQTKVQFIQNATSTVIEFDASLKENHTRPSPPTKFPIENGQTISDHVIIEPFELELTAMITNSPIGGLQGLLTEGVTSLAGSLIPPAGIIVAAGAYSLISGIAGAKSPSVAAYNQILQLQQNAQPFDVLTSIYRYPSMWISNLSVPRDAETGDALVFDIKLVQLILVSPQSVNVQVFANPSLAANKADLGQQGLNLPNGFAQGQKAFNNLVGGH